MLGFSIRNGRSIAGSKLDIASRRSPSGVKRAPHVNFAEPVSRVPGASPWEGPMSLVTGQHHEAEDKAHDKTGAGREGRCGSPSHELNFLAGVMWLHIENSV